MITYAVIGHNEAATLRLALDQARAAAREGDRVLFVDSASTDGSAELATRLGVETLTAPLGKGRAMTVALERRVTSHICFIDADIERTTRNVPRALRRTLDRTGADMVVAEFEWPAKPVQPITTAIWRPLAGALFPEALAAVPRVPLSGFRVLDARLVTAPLPGGFGAEVHLNILGALDGRTATVDVGTYAGQVRNNAAMPQEIAAAILDQAERRGRLDRRARPEWERWLDRVFELIRAGPEGAGGMDAWKERADAAARRPLPGTGVRRGASERPLGGGARA